MASIIMSKFVKTASTEEASASGKLHSLNLFQDFLTTVSGKTDEYQRISGEDGKQDKNTDLNTAFDSRRHRYLLLSEILDNQQCDFDRGYDR